MAYRFMVAGRVASWPLVPCAYDLLVDCGDGILRVQVKTAYPTKGSAWRVRLTKRNEKADQPITVSSVDYVCVVCDPNRIYVIPSLKVTSRIRPDCLVPRLHIYEGADRFKGELNAFAVGAGCRIRGAEDQRFLTAMEAIDLRTPMYPTELPPAAAGRRKQRYSREQILQLRRDLGPTPTTGAIIAAAERWNVSEMTIRNYLRGNRKDLRTVVVPDLPLAVNQDRPIGPVALKAGPHEVVGSGKKTCGNPNCKHPEWQHAVGWCEFPGCPCRGFK